MKRFQFLNGRWVKSQKIVQFPKKGFDPSSYLAQVLDKGTSSTTENCDKTSDSISYHDIELNDTTDAQGKTVQCKENSKKCQEIVDGAGDKNSNVAVKEMSNNNNPDAIKSNHVKYDLYAMSVS